MALRWRVSAENATNANSRLVGAGIKALLSIIAVASMPPVVVVSMADLLQDTTKYAARK